MLPAFLTAILWSFSVIFAGRTSRVLGGTNANFLRMLVSLGLLAAWAHVFGAGVGGRSFGWFVVSGVIGFGFGDLALYQSLPRLGPRLAILLTQCLAAPFAAVAEYFWLGTVLAPVEILAGGITLVGVGLAVAPDRRFDVSGRELSAGVAFGVFAALGQGLGAVVSRKAYAVAAADAFVIDGISAAYQRMLGGMLVVVPFFLLVLGWRSRIGRDARLGILVRSRVLWLLVLANALSGAVLGVGCYQWALQSAPSGVVLPIVALTPVVTLPLAMLIDGDRPGPRSLVGGLVAVAGSVLLALVRAA